jgi:hypothetical protein
VDMITPMRRDPLRLFLLHIIVAPVAALRGLSWRVLTTWVPKGLGQHSVKDHDLYLSLSD